MQINNMQHSKIFSITIFFISWIFIYCTIPKQDCSRVRNGHFYFYGKATGISYQIIRKDSLQMEINSKSKDTSFWKIDWIDDCSYKAKYLHGGGDDLTEMKDFLLQHNTCIRINQVGSEFYVFKVSLDSFNSRQFAIDTAWMKTK